ncbi:ARF/SAR family small GTPase [Naegleria gruberi]|uniref:ARF/SAR family small GTPase n=1 Tax=Naegleria gruberi TaxID=5762 RepID=D2W188_NAEGR|nr:ARF/SAR family small GTPase [Naegleria gruberi]EFC37141.1 ARF/SAR family small GTPase [Naegleria gruberi]|eukprot:XP_002669885.1 ARF/SAR family small GTPase [Naegleria gruberi strain NEG-M]
MGNVIPVNTLFLGIDGAGKTTIINTGMNKFKQLKQEQIDAIQPTLGHDSKRFTVEGVEFISWDFPGKEQLRSTWTSYYKHAQVIVFVVDSSDSDERLEEVKEILHSIIQNVQLRECLLLILGNKQDLNSTRNLDKLKDTLGLGGNLSGLRDRTWKILTCTAKTGDGLEDAFKWLSTETMKAYKKRESKKKEEKKEETKK